MKRVCVVGGGLAGLSAAWSLRAAGVDVTLFEKDAVAGGVVRSHLIDGYLFEEGPTTVPAAAPTLRSLIVEAGLTDRVLGELPSAKRRYVWRHRKLYSVSSHPLRLLTSGLVSPLGRLRMLREPWIKPVSRDDGAPPESLASFLERRLGAEAVAALVDPMVGGVFAARPAELGVEAFPKLAAWEQEHGSLVRGAIASRKQAREKAEETDLADVALSGRSLLSFPEGLAELPRALVREMGPLVAVSSAVTNLSRTSDAAGGSWSVTVEDATSASEHEFDAVVLAVTPGAAAKLLSTCEPEAAAQLGSIESTPLAVVTLGYRREAVAHPLDGFGLLCASDSPVLDRGIAAGTSSVLGVLFNSSIFPGRAPRDHVTLTVMIGGTRDPVAADRPIDDLLVMAHAAAVRLLGIRMRPAAGRVKKWPQAIPRYRPGHARRMAEVLERTRALPGLALAGNYLSGVGLEAAALSGADAATELVTGYSPMGRSE